MERFGYCCNAECLKGNADRPMEDREAGKEAAGNGGPGFGTGLGVGMEIPLDLAVETTMSSRQYEAITLSFIEMICSFFFF